MIPLFCSDKIEKYGIPFIPANFEIMRPAELKTKIFLDSGNPEETKKALEVLGFLDGQTTNPSLIAKNPQMQQRKIEKGKLTEQEVQEFYKTVIEEIAHLLPHGSISIEVAATEETVAEDMLSQAREMNSWIPNAHIKFPTTAEGLKAAEIFSKEGGRVNMTLVFSQDQAAAIHVATQGAAKGNIFVSPFIGRLDDIGENGLNLIQNILAMYKKQMSQVEVLAASVRTMDHFLSCLTLGADIITAPLSILLEWANQDFPIPVEPLSMEKEGLKAIPYELLETHSTWQAYTLTHPLTSKGLQKFASDWEALLH